MLTTQESPTIRCGQWAMTCVVDFKKMAFCTLFVKDGVAERVALDLRLHDDALDHAGNLSTTLITFSDAYITKGVQCAKHFNA